MQFTPRETETRDSDRLLFKSLEPVIRGIEMSLIELSVFHGKGRGGNSRNVQVKAVVYKNGTVGIEDCARVHRVIMPRLELAFPGQEIYLEVSSPGIDRIIKDGGEFVHFIGQGVKCYRTDISGWTAGDESVRLNFDVIAKAKLISSQEV